VLELSQTGQGGFSALAQIGENPVEYQVQAVGSLGLADPCPPGELSGDVRLPHFGNHGSRQGARGGRCRLGHRL
jgi:hypothetical protein